MYSVIDILLAEGLYDGDVQDLEAKLPSILGKSAYQADFNSNDTTSPSYVQNKPTIEGKEIKGELLLTDITRQLLNLLYINPTPGSDEKGTYMLVVHAPNDDEALIDFGEATITLGGTTLDCWVQRLLGLSVVDGAINTTYEGE